MRSVSVREMRTALPGIEQLLAEKGEIVVTRNGKPLARVLPTVPQGGIPSMAELRARMERLEVGSAALIREDRDVRG
jgi:antitoxin (DNA-binding transcriptional repressor) of toxin-antitoxin stability system